MASSISKLIPLVFIILFHSFAIATNFSLKSFQSISDDGEATLVSMEGSFELEFFNTKGNPGHRFVGIWYKKIPVQTVVWVANRCDPILGFSGVLTMNSAGNLVVLNHNKSVVWSTNSSRRVKRPIVELLDSGNLVLRNEDERDSEENYLWQSFDYPSDTFLAGMKLGWDSKRGIKRRLSAWKNTDDPCPGDFTSGFEFDPKLHTFPELCYRKGSTKFYRTGPWNGLRFSGSPELRPNPLYGFRFVHNEDEFYYMFDLKNASVVTMIVLNQTLSARQRLTWVESNQAWNLYSTVPRDQCDYYGVCGANGNCILGENPICQCLKGFKPKSREKWDLMDWSDGCVRKKPLTCLETDGNNVGFAKFSGLKLPHTMRSWVNIREFPSGGQDLFIRMPNSELDKGETNQKIIILVSSIGGFSAIIFSLWFWIFKRRAFGVDGNKNDDIELPLYDFTTISAATNNFSDTSIIGKGGFGPVYKGRLSTGLEIAVKRLSSNSGQGSEEFKNEVLLISKLQHRNLVALLGCCIEGEERILIYEYMCNKSLDSFIFDCEKCAVLKWEERIRIVVGIARGLLYLHQDSKLKIIHRDLKLSNILLDGKMSPKISDFGLARIFEGDESETKTKRVIGTYGYMSPEYVVDGKFSVKSDVFSFGVVLLELISGTRNRGFSHPDHNHNLLGHVWLLWSQDKSFELLASTSFVDSAVESQVLRCIQLGLLCVQKFPVDRPTMEFVVSMLANEGSHMPLPKQPAFFVERSSFCEDFNFRKQDLYTGSDTSGISLEGR